MTIVVWINVLSRPVYKHLMVDSINYCIAHKGLKVYCWCLMSNHLHFIVCAGGCFSDILRDLKKLTSKALIKAIEEGPESRRECLPSGQAGMLNQFWYECKNDHKIKYYRVWQEGNDAQEIHSNAFWEEKK